MSDLIGKKVKVIQETSEDSPLADNGWKVGDVGVVTLVLTDHPEYNIIVQKGDDKYNTLGFSREELEVLE
jgi:hypothetical protein